MAKPASSHLQELRGKDSVQISIDAIDLEIKLLDSDVRRVLSALHGTNNETYAGSSNSTPEGKAFLQQELDGLLEVKTQYKEIKAARVQLQRDLPLKAIDAEIARVDAEAMAVLSSIQGRPPTVGSPYAGKSQEALRVQLDRLSKEKARLKEEKLSVVLLQQQDEKGLPPTDGADRDAVAATTILWTETVTSGTYDAPKKSAALYAHDAVLWGTEVFGPEDLCGAEAESVRDTPQQIYAYFDYFARLPELRMVEYAPAAVRVCGDFAAQAGTYSFVWKGDDGAPMKMRARFSLTFRRGKPGSPFAWMIVEHRFSSMPTSLTELDIVRDGSDPKSLAGGANGNAAQAAGEKTASASAEKEASTKNTEGGPVAESTSMAAKQGGPAKATGAVRTNKGANAAKQSHSGEEARSAGGWTEATKSKKAPKRGVNERVRKAGEATTVGRARMAENKRAAERARAMREAKGAKARLVEEGRVAQRAREAKETRAEREAREAEEVRLVEEEWAAQRAREGKGAKAMERIESAKEAKSAGGATPAEGEELAEAATAKAAAAEGATGAAVAETKRGGDANQARAAGEGPQEAAMSLKGDQDTAAAAAPAVDSQWRLGRLFRVFSFNPKPEFAVPDPCTAAGGVAEEARAPKEAGELTRSIAAERVVMEAGVELEVIGSRRSAEGSTTSGPEPFRAPCPADAHEVTVTAVVGTTGLGLMLGEEEEGTRWVITGFRSMAEGVPNPAKAAGLEVGDTLQQLNGVQLGSYMDGMELLHKQFGPVVLTAYRRNVPPPTPSVSGGDDACAPERLPAASNDGAGSSLPPPPTSTAAAVESASKPGGQRTPPIVRSPSSGEQLDRVSAMPEEQRAAQKTPNSHHPAPSVRDSRSDRDKSIVSSSEKEERTSGDHSNGALVVSSSTSEGQCPPKATRSLSADDRPDRGSVASKKPEERDTTQNQTRSLSTGDASTDAYDMEQRVESALSLAANRARQIAVLEGRANKAHSVAVARAKRISELEQRVDSAMALAAERAKQAAAFEERANKAINLAAAAGVTGSGVASAKDGKHPSDGGGISGQGAILAAERAQLARQTARLDQRARQVRELEQRVESAQSLAAERARQVRRLEQRAETAELLAAERGKQVVVLKERAERAKFVADQRTKQVKELEHRGKSVGTLAAERAKEVKELGLRAGTAEVLAAERGTQVKELEQRAESAEANARDLATQVCELDHRLALERAKQLGALEQRAERSKHLETATLKKIAELEEKLRGAESVAADRAREVARHEERAGAAESLARSAESTAAEREETIEELRARVTRAETEAAAAAATESAATEAAAEAAMRVEELERRAESARVLATSAAKQIAELEVRAESAEAEARERGALASRALEAAVMVEEGSKPMQEQVLASLDLAEERVRQVEERSERLLKEAKGECAASLERVTRRAVKREEEARRRERVAVEMEAKAMKMLQLAAEEQLRGLSPQQQEVVQHGGACVSASVLATQVGYDGAP